MLPNDTLPPELRLAVGKTAVLEYAYVRFDSKGRFHPMESSGKSDSPTVALAATREQVQAVLDTVRPAMQLDGGDCELVEVTDDGVVKLRLQGACGGCPSSTMTLSQGIEKRMKAKLPGIRAVVAV